MKKLCLLLALIFVSEVKAIAKPSLMNTQGENIIRVLVPGGVNTETFQMTIKYKCYATNLEVMCFSNSVSPLPGDQNWDTAGPNKLLPGTNGVWTEVTLYWPNNWYKPSVDLWIQVNARDSLSQWSTTNLMKKVKPPIVP